MEKLHLLVESTSRTNWRKLLLLFHISVYRRFLFQQCQCRTEYSNQYSFSYYERCLEDCNRRA